MTQPQAPNVLLSLLVTLLAPLFFTACSGDLQFARCAALETINTYRARNDIDLLTIAQIVAFGLTALGSLGLSLADDLSLSMTLRLRSNAIALNRAAERCQRTLRESQVEASAPPPPPADPAFDEASVIAAVTATRQRVAEAAAPAVAEPIPTQPAPPQPARQKQPTGEDRQLQAAWAAAMADVAGEFTASLAHLPPAERKAMTVRAAALSSCANDLLAGKGAPGLGAGDIAALMRSPAP